MNFLSALFGIYAASLWFWLRVMGALLLAGIGGAILGNFIVSSFGLGEDVADYLVRPAGFFLMLGGAAIAYERYQRRRFFNED